MSLLNATHRQLSLSPLYYDVLQQSRYYLIVVSLIKHLMHELPTISEMILSITYYRMRQTPMIFESLFYPLR